MARILDEPPMLLSDVLQGDARLTPKWAHGGLKEDYMRGVTGHIAVGCYEGQHQISWRIENKLLNSRTNPKAFTLIPQGVDGHWNIAGPVVVSHVYLTQERLQACADEVAGGRRVEILPRVAFADPAAAGLLEILSHEAERDSASSRLFVERAIDLLCLRLVQEHSSFGALPAQGRKGGLAGWQVKRVTAFMAENLNRHIGLDELAALVDLSRFHFCTAFRRSTCQSAFDWGSDSYVERPGLQGLSLIEQGMAVRSYVRPVNAAPAAGHDDVRGSNRPINFARSKRSESGGLIATGNVVIQCSSRLHPASSAAFFFRR